MTVKATTWTMRAAAIVCAGTLLVGCTSEDPDTEGAAPDTNSSKSAESTVDVEALDTGDYPTEPAPPFGLATTEDILDVEGQRMAEFVTIPYEVDPELTFVDSSPNVIRSADALSVLIATGAGDVARENRFLSGYSTRAAKTEFIRTQPMHQINHTILRFQDPEGAEATARRLHDQMIAGTDDEPAQEKLTLEAHPETLASLSRYEDPDAGGHERFTAFTPHGDYVIATIVTAPEGETAWLAETASTAVELQKPLIERFPATPTRARNNGEAPDMPQVDQGRIQIYAIPEDEENNPNGDDRAGYGPRGMGHRSGDPRLVEVLTETGPEHNAVGDSTVYRASDEAGAEKIYQTVVNSLLSRGAVEEPSPEGLPVAKCYSVATQYGVEDHCFLREGRYVASVGALTALGEDNKPSVLQRTSAQYLILQHADQNA